MLPRRRRDAATQVAFCILPHVLISIFIHRVVYKREVDKMWFLGCAAVEARCCPNRYARRVVESERRYHDSGKDPQTGERPPMPKRRASKKLAVAKAAVCDESYVVRFWLLYATANFLLLFALGIVMFLLVLAGRPRGTGIDSRTGRGDAAAAMWMFHGGESRRRRGRDVDSPRRRIAATPRPRRG